MPGPRGCQLDIEPRRSPVKFKRYPDRCYAVVRGKRRGPCGHDKVTALARFRRSGLIASARTD